jgi:hypothetical protein
MSSPRSWAAIGLCLVALGLCGAAGYFMWQMSMRDDWLGSYLLGLTVAITADGIVIFAGQVAKRHREGK